jgi:hypothetical protein
MITIEKLLGEPIKDAFILYLKASEIVFMKDLLAKPEILRQGLVDIGLFDQVKELFNAAVDH